MTEQFKIDESNTYISIEDDFNERVPAIQSANLAMPLVDAGRVRAAYIKKLEKKYITNIGQQDEL